MVYWKRIQTYNSELTIDLIFAGKKEELHKLMLLEKVGWVCLLNVIITVSVIQGLTFVVFSIGEELLFTYLIIYTIKWISALCNCDPWSLNFLSNPQQNEPTNYVIFNL